MMHRISRPMFCVGLVIWLQFSCFSQSGLGQESASVALPKIVPPSMESDRQVIPLPASVDDIDVGGGGRYLGLHFKTLKKIGIFDVNTLKIVGYIPANEDDTKFALGATKAIVVSGDRGVISRYDLATLKRELTQSIDIKGSAVHVLFGSASAGPALVSSNGESFHDGVAFIVDIQSLKPTPLKVKNLNRGFGSRANIRISANGNVLGTWESGVSPSGLQTLVKTGDHWDCHYEHTSVGYVVPAPDGRHIYTARGILTSQLRNVSQGSESLKHAIPATQGPYSICVSVDDPHRNQSNETIHLKISGDSRSLAKISHLDKVYDPDDRFSRQKFTLDKRLFLVPDAKLIVQLASTEDKLIAAKFDIDEALKGSEFDYLIVSSRPPLQIKAGDAVEYQVCVKSKAGGVKYSLDAAPESMTISDTGLLTWKTSAKSPAKSEVIISISDQSKQQTFHAFSLTVMGGTTGSSVLQSVRSDSPPKTVKTTPAHLASESVEVKLPDMASSVTVGASGRYLFLRIKQLKKIAVLDVSEGKIVRYLPAVDDNTKIAAGATRALIFNCTQGVVSRYRLDTMEKDLTTTIPFSASIRHVGMGAGSEGPLLVLFEEDNRSLPKNFTFLDVNTMRPIKITLPNQQRHWLSMDNNSSIRVSTNGEAFVVGSKVVRLSGTSARIVTASNFFAAFPSADGKFFLSRGKIFNASLKPIGDQSVRYGTCIPSVTGRYFLSFSNGSYHFGRDTKEKVSGKFYMLGDDRPLVTIPDLFEQHSLSSRFTTHQKIEQRIVLIPDAKVIATIPPSNDLVRLRKFDIDEALDASGVDYLIVDSQAPPHAKLGNAYEYALSVKSKKGGPKFKLDAAPEGMKISTTGKITWSVPKTLNSPEHKVIVSVRDDSGQSMFHTFSIDIPEISKKQSLERLKEEELRKLAAVKALQAAMEARRKSIEVAKPRPKSFAEGLGDTINTLQQVLEKKAKQQAELAAKNTSTPKSKFTFRTWTDASGSHQTKAIFVEILDRSTVVLELESGEKRKVHLSKLSNSDIYEAVRCDLERLGKLGVQPPKENPFNQMKK